MITVVVEVTAFVLGAITSLTRIRLTALVGTISSITIAKLLPKLLPT